MDAASRSGWYGLDWYKRREPELVETVGYLITKNKKCVTVIQSFNDLKSVDGALTIPRGCVQSIEILGKSNDNK